MTWSAVVRMSAAVAISAVLLTGCSVPSLGSNPRSGGTSPTQIYGARTGAGGRSLVIGYEDGGCGGTPRPSSRQTATDVTVTVDLVTASTTGACPADSQPKILVVALAAPLGHRRVVDGSTHKTVGVFDGSRLLHPTVFPDAVTVRRDLAPGSASTSQRDWAQSYSRVTPQPGCTLGPTVLVAEGTNIGSAANNVFTPVSGPHRVAGTTAQFLQDPSAPGWYYLEWAPPSRPGWRIFIQSEQDCRRGPALTTADLLRFADSVR